jgi:hypothetical protein
MAWVEMEIENTYGRDVVWKEPRYPASLVSFDYRGWPVYAGMGGRNQWPVWTGIRIPHV